jgi:hypothetical protein
MEYRMVQIYHRDVQVGQGGTGVIRTEADGQDHLFVTVTWNMDPVKNYHTKTLVVKAQNEKGETIQENRELLAVEPKMNDSVSNFGQAV